MMNLSVPLLVLIVAMVASAQDVRYVKPSNPTTFQTCPGQPCLTLDEYLFMSTTYFSSGASFVFLAGNHTLEYSTLLENVSNISFRGEKTDYDEVYLIFAEDAYAWFDNVTNFSVEGMWFWFESTSTHYASLHFSNCANVQITNSIFQEMNGRTAIISSWNSSMIFQECFFYNNTGLLTGALWLSDSNTTLQGCRFAKNKGKFRGGAIDARNCSIQIVNTTFTWNRGKNGGAIGAQNSVLTLKGGFFNNNWARMRGGAIYAENSVLTMKGDFLSENWARMRGGAINIESSILSLNSNQFFRNSAGFRGGGVSANSSIVKFTGTFFVLNKANMSGPAIFANNSRVYRNETFHNDFVSNIAADKGDEPTHFLNTDYKTVGGIFDRPPQKVAHSAGLTYPMLRGLVSPSIVAYYSMMQGEGNVGIVASLNETKIILTGSSPQNEEKYMLYSVKNPRVLSFINRARPVSIIDSLSGRNGFLASMRAVEDAQNIFRNLETATNSRCSNCNLKLMGIAYFANSSFSRVL